jgi:hypothetical protein
VYADVGSHRRGETIAADLRVMHPTEFRRA